MRKKLTYQLSGGVLCGLLGLALSAVGGGEAQAAGSEFATFRPAAAPGTYRAGKAPFDALRRNAAEWPAPAADDAVDGVLAAIRGGDREELLRLLRQGVSPNARARGGERPLVVAAGEGRAGIVRELLNAGATVDALAAPGFSALGIAALRGHADVVRLLLRHGAAADRPNADGSTALTLAISLDHGAVVDLLLDHGADPRRRDHAGRHALAVAAAHGSAASAARLLARGLNPGDADGSGRSAVQWAQDSGHPALAADLQRAAAGAALAAARR